MGKIFIVRHGQDEDNAKLILNGRRDKPLTRLIVLTINVQNASIFIWLLALGLMKKRMSC